MLSRLGNLLRCAVAGSVLASVCLVTATDAEPFPSFAVYCPDIHATFKGEHGLAADVDRFSLHVAYASMIEAVAFDFVEGGARVRWSFLEQEAIGQGDRVFPVTKQPNGGLELCKEFAGDKPLCIRFRRVFDPFARLVGRWSGVGTRVGVSAVDIEPDGLIRIAVGAEVRRVRIPESTWSLVDNATGRVSLPVADGIALAVDGGDMTLELATGDTLLRREWGPEGWLSGWWEIDQEALEQEPAWSFSTPSERDDILRSLDDLGLAHSLGVRLHGDGHIQLIRPERPEPDEGDRSLRVVASMGDRLALEANEGAEFWVFIRSSGRILIKADDSMPVPFRLVSRDMPPARQ